MSILPSPSWSQSLMRNSASLCEMVLPSLASTSPRSAPSAWGTRPRRPPPWTPRSEPSPTHRCRQHTMQYACCHRASRCAKDACAAQNNLVCRLTRQGGSHSSSRYQVEWKNEPRYLNKIFEVDYCMRCRRHICVAPKWAKATHMRCLRRICVTDQSV